MYPEYLNTALSAGVDAELKTTKNDTGIETTHLELKGTRKVMVWPHNGTVYAPPVKRKPRGMKAVNVKKLSPTAALYLAIQIALGQR